MTPNTMMTIILALAALLTLSACGNTIRGMGRDVAGTVHATQQAGRTVEKAAK